MYGTVRKDGVNSGKSLLVQQRDDNTTETGAEDYLYSLLYPLNLTTLARIPDLNGHPVCCYTDQIEATIDIQSQAAGAGVHGFTVWFQNGSLFLVNEGTTSTAVNCTYDATSTVTMGVATTANVAAYSQARLVSGGFQMEFLGNDSNNAGLVTVAYLSKPEINAAGATVSNICKTNQTNLQNARNTWSGAFKNGCKSRYVPLDPQDFVFNVLTSASPMAWNTAVSTQVQRAAIQVHIVANQAVSVRITAVAHFEGLSADDANGGGHQVRCAYDPMGLANAVNTIQSVDTTMSLVGSPDTGLQNASDRRLAIQTYRRRGGGVTSSMFAHLLPSNFVTPDRPTKKSRRS